MFESIFVGRFDSYLWIDCDFDVLTIEEKLKFTEFVRKNMSIFFVDGSEDSAFGDEIFSLYTLGTRRPEEVRKCVDYALS